MEKTKFTVRNIIRAISAALILLFFCPACLVSCSGMTMKISAMKAARGVKSAYGDMLTSPEPVMLLALFIPLAILVATFIDAIEHKTLAAIVAGSSLCDIALWAAFYKKAREIAEYNMCSIKMSYGLTLSLVLLARMLLCGGLVYLGNADRDVTTLDFSKKEEPKNEGEGVTG